MLFIYINGASFHQWQHLLPLSSPCKPDSKALAFRSTCTWDPRWY